MRLVKLALAAILLLGVFLYHVPSDAKGPVDRIRIKGPGLTEEVVVDDPEITALLSMAALEDFQVQPTTLNTGTPTEVVPPENLGEPYELERQFRDGATYFTFDRVHYYPDPEGGRGYVYYVGIENGGSEYDGKWFRATETGDLAMTYSLNTAHLDSYLAAVNGNGEVYLLNPETLETTATLTLSGGDDWFYGADLFAPQDGQRLFLSRWYGNGQRSEVFDLATGTSCGFGSWEVVTQTMNGDHLVVQAPNTLATLDAGTLELISNADLPSSDGGSQQYPSNSVLSVTPDFQRVYSLYNSSVPGESMISVYDFETQEFEESHTISSIEEANGGYSGIWSIFGEFYITNGESLIRWSDHSMTPFPLRMVLPDVEIFREAGVQLVPFATKYENLYLHPRLGTYWIYDYDAVTEGGIYTVSTFDGHSRRWYEYILFHQVITAKGMFYGLQALPGAETVQLYQLSMEHETVRGSVDLPAGTNYIAMVRLDPAVVADMAFQPCASAYFEETASLPVTPPPTAAPGK